MEGLIQSEIRTKIEGRVLISPSGRKFFFLLFCSSNVFSYGLRVSNGGEVSTKKGTK